MCEGQLKGMPLVVLFGVLQGQCLSHDMTAVRRPELLGGHRLLAMTGDAAVRCCTRYGCLLVSRYLSIALLSMGVDLGVLMLRHSFARSGTRRAGQLLLHRS